MKQFYSNNFLRIVLLICSIFKVNLLSSKVFKLIEAKIFPNFINLTCNRADIYFETFVPDILTLTKFSEEQRN